MRVGGDSFTPGHTTALRPQVMIVIPCGTAKSLYFFGSVERLIVVLPGTAGAFAASTALSMSACAWARVCTGPATRRFLSSKT